MSPILEKIEQEVLNLPEQERAFLADRLLSSLQGSPLSEIDTAWIFEAERRYDGFKTGKRKPVSFDQVMADADRLLK
jgi:putative addiction module component (TIGR02574 family)